MGECFPVLFENSESLKLFGILHVPDSIQRQRPVILMLSPGIKSRIAPHRLYVKFARRFADMGFMVFRFDFHGLGDSEGEVEEEFVADLYGSIQSGRYVKDTVSAMDWLEREYGVKKFVLAGLCGGAITGLLAGKQDLRVDSLIGLGIPVILDGSQVDHTKYRTTGSLRQYRDVYLGKITDLKSWVRLLTFRSSYSTIMKSLILPIIASLKGGTDQQRSDKANAKQEEIHRNLAENFNPLFPDAFLDMVSTRKILLVFSGDDRLYWEFSDKYYQYFSDTLKPFENNYKICVVKNANHIFSFGEWEKEMLSICTEWLNSVYST